jgi:hypothetical protein
MLAANSLSANYFLVMITFRAAADRDRDRDGSSVSRGHPALSPIRSLDDAAAVIVLVDDAMSQTNVDSLVECLGDMESVDIMRFGHDGHGRLCVSLRHGGSEVLCSYGRGRRSCFRRASTVAKRVCDSCRKTL